MITRTCSVCGHSRIGPEEWPEPFMCWSCSQGGQEGTVSLGLYYTACIICGKNFRTDDMHQRICGLCRKGPKAMRETVTKFEELCQPPTQRSAKMACHTYEYRIVETYQTAENRTECGDVEPKILVKGEIPYASNRQFAEQEVTRLIPEDYKASQVEIYVRPFVQ